MFIRDAAARRRIRALQERRFAAVLAGDRTQRLDLEEQIEAERLEALRRQRAQMRDAYAAEGIDLGPLHAAMYGDEECEAARADAR